MYGSFFLMSVFDLIIVSTVIFACVKLYQDRSKLQVARRGVYLLSLGLLLFGGVYLFDLFLMWIAPSIITMQVAMSWMDQLHLEFHWIVSLIAVLCIASGTGIIVNSLLHVEEKLRTEIEERQISEGEKQTLVAQLYHNQKIEALGTLAGGIAHDFNNIITVILNNAEMMKIKKEQNIDTEDSINNIIKSSERAAGLVKQILTYSRMESVALQPINLSKEVKAALAMVRASIPKNVNITTDLDEDIPLISGDATQISQIVINLCTNANHAIGEHAGEIKVKVKPLNSGSSEFVLLTIEDDGCGIDAECLGRIFDPFFTTKEVDKGTGLGLSAVHGIVENHNANISVKSDLDKGSEFSIKFPLSENMQSVAPVIAIPDVRKNGNILLVEDDTEIGDLYKQHLLS